MSNNFTNGHTVVEIRKEPINQVSKPWSAFVYGDKRPIMYDFKTRTSLVAELEAIGYSEYEGDPETEGWCNLILGKTT